MRAKVNVGDVIISLPVEYLNQQTAVSSVFDGVPRESVDVSALIDANKTLGVTWYHHYDAAEAVVALHIAVPTDLIEWED